mgnify:CR=1 FL=1
MSYKITEIEQKYVHDVYDEIASHWKQTRARKCTYWKTVINFINSDCSRINSDEAIQLRSG